MKAELTPSEILDTRKRPTRPRGKSAKVAIRPVARLRLATALWLAALVLVGVVAGCGRSDSSIANTDQKYHCPMHPTYVSDRAGDCPICNMKLVLIKQDKQPPAKTPPQRDYQPKLGEYFCTMQCPGSITNQPGRCPECGMNLVLMDEQRAKAMAAEQETAVQPPPVPGRISIRISPDKRQMIGLRLAQVEKRPLTNTVRATAVVTHDETRYARVAPRFGGWVRKVHVNFTGAPVVKGQPLFTVYSPELFSAQNEYLIAWRGLQQLRPNAPLDQRESATNLLNSAPRRLELWEVGEAEIRALEQHGTADDEMVFRAPLSGYVVRKSAVQGKAFMAGESLYELADLLRVWLEAWIVESDMPLMRPGLQATITFPSLGNRTFTAPITFIYPSIDPQTRRGRVRLELDNPNHLLRPDMWASVEIQIPLGERLLIPASAVIDTGQRFIAFVDGEDEHLQPREVKVGFKTDDYYEVLEGVKEGEKVVTRALFLVDSESQLKAAIVGMGSGGEHQH